VVEFVLIDLCAHAFRVRVSGDGENYRCIHDALTIPVRTGDPESLLRLAVDSVPRFVRIEAGGYARFGVANIRCETLDGDVLPRRVVGTQGEVLDADHLLAWDQRCAILNEADVEAKWNAPGDTPTHSVVLEMAVG
jgi:hypothetical protein